MQRTTRFGILLGLGLFGGLGCASGPGVVGRVGDAVGMNSERSFVERHPVLAEPRRYYNGAGENPVVKVTAGAIGVPVGIAKETAQFVRGQ